MTRTQEMGRSGHGRSTMMKLIFLLLISIEFGQSRPPSFDITSYGRSLSNRPFKSKRTRGGVPMSVPSPPIPVLDNTDSSPNIPEFDDEVNVGTSNNMRQWLEFESVPTERVSAKLHSEVVLECIAVGSPPPMIYWLKDGKAIESLPFFDSEELQNGLEAQVQSPFSGFSMAKTKSKLPIRCIRPEDEGEYSCIATQIDGPTQSGAGPRRLVSSAMVIIDEDDKSEDWKPECEFRLPAFVFNGKKGRRGTPAYVHSTESIHMEVIGNNVILPCRAGGKPKPKVQWFDSEGQQILLGKKFKVNTNGDLIIRSMSWNEMGEYKCQVENSYGVESVITFLYPLLAEDR